MTSLVKPGWKVPLKALPKHPFNRVPHSCLEWERTRISVVRLAYANDSCPCLPGFQAGALTKEGEQKASSNYSICGGPKFHDVNGDLVTTVYLYKQ